MIRRFLRWLGWPQAPELKTYRRLHFSPLPNITAYEVALCMNVETWDEFELSPFDMWQGVPPTVQRHFTLTERDTIGGRHVSGPRPCFVIHTEEPNSKVWEACARRPYYQLNEAERAERDRS